MALNLWIKVWVSKFSSQNVIGAGPYLPIAIRSEISKGRLPFHPIPCGPTLIGHVTSGTTYMTVSSPVSNHFTVIHLPTYQFHGGAYTRLLLHGTSNTTSHTSFCQVSMWCKSELIVKFDHQCLTSSFQGLLSQHELIPCSMLRIKLFQMGGWIINNQVGSMLFTVNSWIMIFCQESKSSGSSWNLNSRPSEYRSDALTSHLNLWQRAEDNLQAALPRDLS